MPAYRYQAIDAQGRNVSGLVEADTPRSARNQLRAQSLIPLDVTPTAMANSDGDSAGRPLWQQTLWTRQTLSGQALGIVTRQLASLVGAGLPLERALGVLADEAEQPDTQALLANLRAEVNAGHPLATALSPYPREFDASYVAVVAAGEQGGRLDTVLHRLADDLDSRDQLRQKLLAAALYPGIITVFASLIVVFLMAYVVPQVANAFASGGRSLPLITTAMLAISAWLRNWGGVLLLLLPVLVSGLVWWRRQPTARQWLDALWLRLPLLGRLAQGYNAARFASTLGMLVQAGVPILRALQTAADTLHNQALRSQALMALTQVREGAPLASALAAQGGFPGLLCLFIRLGEQTGELPSMLQRAADQLGNDVQRRALRLATLLEPLLIVAMGVVVLLIVLAVMMPIIELNQLVGTRD